MFRKVRVGAIPTRNSKPVIQFVDRERKISVSYNLKTTYFGCASSGGIAEVSFFDAKFFIYHKRKKQRMQAQRAILKACTRVGVLPTQNNGTS